MIAKKVNSHLKICYNTLGQYIWWKPQIKSIDETLDYIRETHCSVSRFGDGEFTVIQGHSNGFQERNSELGKRLAAILIEPVDNHIVCLPDIFGDQKGLKKSSKEFFNGLLGQERRAWLKLLDRRMTYYNAFFTRCYNMFEDKSMCGTWFEKNKMIWEDQDILLIEGVHSRLGIGNDLFAGAKTVQRILAPATSAYSRYQEIYDAAIQYGKSKLILIALGMTATVLAYDLAKNGMWAIDIGHIDVEYEWYLRRATTKIALEGKYVNEVAGGDKVSDEVDPIYWKQIIKTIK